MTDTINELAVFIGIAESASLTRAAIKMDMSLSAVSRHLSALEKRLGVNLVVRHAKQFALTQEGMLYFERGKAILNDLTEAEEEVSRKGVIRGQIKVGSVHGFGRAYLAPLLAKFSRLHPEIQVSLHLSDKLDFLDDGLDVALQLEPPNKDSYVVCDLGKSRRVIVASPEYLRDAPPLKTPKDLLAHRCICLNREEFVMDEWLLLQHGQPLRVKVRPYLLTDSGEILRDWAVSGEGVAYKLAWDVAEDIRAGRLVECLTKYSAGKLTLSAVYPWQRYQPARIREFIRFLQAEVPRCIS